MYRYWVVYRDHAENVAGTEVATDHPLDGARGRAEATGQLAARGVDRPQITGWALREPALPRTDAEVEVKP